MRRLHLLAAALVCACTPPMPDWRGGEKEHPAIVDLIRPPRGSGSNTVLPAFNPPSWLFFSQLPESVAFPPDNHNYYSPPVAGTIQYQEPDGQKVSIIDAYGWIWPEGSACTGDPDWHFGFEIDPARTNIDLNVLYKVGNAISHGRSASGADRPNQTYRVLSTTPRVHVEVTGWRKSAHGNIDPSVWGWVHSTPDCENGGVLWAYDPAQPEGKAIPEGAYVHITGLLVTDGFHVCDSRGSNQLPNAPIQLGADRPDGGRECDKGDLQDVKKVWANCHWTTNCTSTESNADNLARWYEIHSPDAIHLEEEQRPQVEVVRQIVLSADHGFFSGMTERIEDDIWPCPAAPSHSCGPLPAGKAVGYVESIDGVTNYRTITDGKCTAQGCVPKVDLYNDHIHVMAQVHGEGLNGAPGKLKVTYRVFACDCGCDGTCQVPGSTARVQCAAPQRCASGSQCRGGMCVCAPDCAGKCNGEPDGCGHACPSCPSGQQCTNGACCAPGTRFCDTIGRCAACCPQCDGSSCGSDGCGGTCRCERGLICKQGACVERGCPAGTRDCGDGNCAPHGRECP